MTEDALPPRPPDFRVAAPATSANLGPGFDSLALALDLWNSIEVWAEDSGEPRIAAIEGEGSETLERDRDNMVLVAMRRLADEAGRSLPACALRLHNAVPVGRGLGSSAAAIAGGLVAATILLGLPSDPEALLPVALSLEHHPDNVAAALYGGFTIGVLEGSEARVLHLTPPAELGAVVLIPDGFSSTLESRKALPTAISRGDAIFNGGRCALLAASLSQGRWDLLRTAMQDRLHQPCRALAFPYLDEAIEAATAAGAHGAALSGAGSSVIALTTKHQDRVAAALAAVARNHRLPARTAVLPLASRGAHRLEAARSET